MIAHLKEGAEAFLHVFPFDYGQEKALESVPVRENRAANPFKLVKSGYGGTGTGVNQGVIAGAEYVRGPLQPTWAAQLADARRQR